VLLGIHTGGDGGGSYFEIGILSKAKLLEPTMSKRLVPLSSIEALTPNDKGGSKGRLVLSGG